MRLPIHDWKHAFISLGARNKDKTERQRGKLEVKPGWPKGSQTGLNDEIRMCVLRHKL